MMPAIPEIDRDQEELIADKDDNKDAADVTSPLPSTTTVTYSLQHQTHPTINVLLNSIHHTLKGTAGSGGDLEAKHPEFLFNVSPVPSVCVGESGQLRDASRRHSSTSNLMQNHLLSPLRPPRLLTAINGQMMNGNGCGEGDSLQVHSADILHLSPGRRFSQFNFNLRRFSQLPTASTAAVLF